MADNAVIEVQRAGGAGVLLAPGYINQVGGEQVAKACDGLIDEGVTKLVLNLEDCNIVNSVGISFLIEVLEKVTELGGRMAFCSVGPTIAKTLQIMGLLQKASIHKTVDEAVAEVSA